MSEQLLAGVEERRDYRAEHAMIFGEPFQLGVREVADMVNSPPHYNQHHIEVIDIIETYFPNNYHLANACKYLLRSGYKGHEIEDLNKLVWYVQRYIEMKERDGLQEMAP